MPYVYEWTASGVSDKTYNIWHEYNIDINVCMRKPEKLQSILYPLFITALVLV